VLETGNSCCRRYKSFRGFVIGCKAVIAVLTRDQQIDGFAGRQVIVKKLLQAGG